MNILNQNELRYRFAIVVLVILVVLFMFNITAFASGQTVIGSNSENLSSTESSNQRVKEIDARHGQVTDVASRMVESGLTVTDAIITEDEAYKKIENELELLKQHDKDMIRKYFGESKEFTEDTIADKLTATRISFISAECNKDTAYVVVHICTLDYNKMNQDYMAYKQGLVKENESISDEDIKRETSTEVAKGVLDGRYDAHYNIPVTVSKDGVIVSEQYKQAITGNWYKGVGSGLESTSCPLNS